MKSFGAVEIPHLFLISLPSGSLPFYVHIPWCSQLVGSKVQGRIVVWRLAEKGHVLLNDRVLEDAGTLQKLGQEKESHTQCGRPVLQIGKVQKKQPCFRAFDTRRRAQSASWVHLATAGGSAGTDEALRSECSLNV